MKKYIFIIFNRYEGINSKVTQVESDKDREEVLKIWLREEFEMDEEDLEEVVPNWKKCEEMWCDDGDEQSYMMIEIKI